MNTDSIKKLVAQHMNNFMRVLSKDHFCKIKGEVFWELRNKDGSTRGGKINTVTMDASILVARFLKGTAAPVANISEPSFGIFALAVGTGDISWNPLAPPPATNTQRSLYNEIGRKQFSSTNFVAADGSISGVPTNVVDYTTTFSESEAVGPLCEMGLLGGDINTNMSIRNPVLPPNGAYDPTVSVVGKDTLINYVTFGVITKPATSTLGWTWRITT
jgi:hypothetical protein